MSMYKRSDDQPENNKGDASVSQGQDEPDAL